MENEEKYNYILSHGSFASIIDDEEFTEFVKEYVEYLFDFIHRQKFDPLQIGMALVKAIILGHEFGIDRIERLSDENTC